MHPAAAPVSRCVCVAERLFAPSAYVGASRHHCHRHRRRHAHRKTHARRHVVHTYLVAAHALRGVCASGWRVGAAYRLLACAHGRASVPVSQCCSSCFQAFSTLVRRSQWSLYTVPPISIAPRLIMQIVTHSIIFTVYNCYS